MPARTSESWFSRQMQRESSWRDDHERRKVSPGRRSGNVPGRRKHDNDPRTTISKKMVVLTVFIVDALYLAGEALLYGQNVCP